MGQEHTQRAQTTEHSPSRRRCHFSSTSFFLYFADLLRSAACIVLLSIAFIAAAVAFSFWIAIHAPTSWIATITMPTPSAPNRIVKTLLSSEVGTKSP